MPQISLESERADFPLPGPAEAFFFFKLFDIAKNDEEYPHGFFVLRSRYNLELGVVDLL